MDFNLPLKFFTEQLAPNWRFNEGMGDNPYVDAYLVVGEKRAAFIDALQSEQPKSLVEQIREITKLPVDVIITHGHRTTPAPKLEAYRGRGSPFT